MQGFQGHGYNQEFIDNMSAIVSTLRSEPDTIVEIVDRCDDICAPCPRKKNDICNRKADKKVLKRLKIKPGTRMKIGEGFEVVNATFRHKKDLKRSCGRCEWHDRCRWYQSRDG